MRIIDNITSLLGDDLKATLAPGAKLKVAASCFSIYAFEVLKKELSEIESLEFIFTSPTFVPNDVSDKLRKELRRLQVEVIDLEDVKTGISITDLGLNDFRMDLLNHVKAPGDLSNFPNGMHAVVPAAPERGLPPGAIFALRNRNDGVNINQQNRLLDLVRAACKERGEAMPEAYQPFNKITKDGRKMETYSNLLNTANGIEDFELIAFLVIMKDEG